MTVATEPQWQCLLIAWGDKYPVDEINHLVAAIRGHAARPPRFLLLTDRARPGLDPEVKTSKIPEFWLQPRFRGPGCHAKLAMFEPGLVPGDLPTVYVDLDTVVLGDLGEIVELLRSRRTIAMLQSAIIPFGAIGRFVFRLTRGLKYARGNSSIVVFNASECSYIAGRFRSLYARYPDLSFRPMAADERFMSWCAQPHMRAVPRNVAVKLPTEFMMPWLWLVHLRGALPWVRRRRARLRAITLPGVEVKGQALLDLEDGAVVTDRKGRKLVWTDRALAPLRPRIIAYYRAIRSGSDNP